MPPRKARQGKVVAGPAVLGLHQHGERAQALRNRVTAERVRQWIGTRRDVRLDHLRDGIEAGGQRHVAGAAIGQGRVDQSQIREHAIVPQTDLAIMRRDADDRVLRGFGTSSGGGWAGDEGQRRAVQRQSVTHDLEMGHRTLIRRDQGRERLAEVDHGASADGDDTVRAGGSGLIQRRLKLGNVRLAPARHSGDRTAPRLQLGSAGVGEGHRAAADEHNLITVAQHFLRQGGGAAPAEDDARHQKRKRTHQRHL